MTYQEAKVIKVGLDEKVSIASKAINAFPKGPMGMTPDDVKRTSEWRAAYSAYNKAFNTLRAFNQMFTKTFKKEDAADRKARYSARVSA